MTDGTKLGVTLGLAVACASAFIVHLIPPRNKPPTAAGTPVAHAVTPGVAGSAATGRPPGSANAGNRTAAGGKPARLAALSPRQTAWGQQRPPAVDPTIVDPAADGTGGGGEPLAPISTGDEVALARDALAYVGTDPRAEAVWSATINDPTVPAEDRKNLIEDLNEDGFPDPHNLTENDVPLIRSRLALIADVAPNAMDQANADAFREAFKDLTNMLNDAHPQ